MVKYNDIYSSGDSLKAADLNGQDITFVISEVEPREFTEDNGDKKMKLVLHFQGFDQTLVCNFTNATSIANMYGDETDGWIGRPVTLFPTRVTFGHKLVDAIRVREQQYAAPPAHAQQPQQPAQQQHSEGNPPPNMGNPLNAG